MPNETRSVHLALIQFESSLCNPEANTEKACRMIAEAAAQGADLVVLPELFSTGYELNIVGPHVPELAEPVDGPTVRALQDAARAGGCYVVAGLALTHEMAGVAYNSAVFIDRDGELQGTYDKQHLWALERFYFRAGFDCPVFDTDFGRVGVMICYDMGFPEVARMLALQGADLILCPSAWCEEDMDVWDVNVPARALENTAFVAAVNESEVSLGRKPSTANAAGSDVPWPAGASADAPMDTLPAPGKSSPAFTEVPCTGMPRLKSIVHVFTWLAS